MEEDRINLIVDRMYNGIYDKADMWELVREINRLNLIIKELEESHGTSQES